MLMVLLIHMQTPPVLIPKNTPKKVVQAQPAPPAGREGDLIEDLVHGTTRLLKNGDGGEGEEDPDVLGDIEGGISDGWAEGDHGNVAIRPHQQENYERSKNQLLGKYSEELNRVYTGGQAYAISPEPDPDEIFNVGDSCGNARVLVWRPMGAMEIRCGEGTDEGHRGTPTGELQLTSLIGPPLPLEWGDMTACDREDWQITQNLVTIGYRMLMPIESEPHGLTLRPQSFYDYFREEHDWCDICYTEEDCDPCPSRGEGECFPLRPKYPRLPMSIHYQGEREPIVWQIDYQVGQSGINENNLVWASETIEFGIQIPVLAPGSFSWQGDNLEDVVDITVICED